MTDTDPTKAKNVGVVYTGPSPTANISTNVYTHTNHKTIQVPGPDIGNANAIHGIDVVVHEMELHVSSCVVSVVGPSGLIPYQPPRHAFPDPNLHLHQDQDPIWSEEESEQQFQAYHKELYQKPETVPQPYT